MTVPPQYDPPRPRALFPPTDYERARPAEQRDAIAHGAVLYMDCDTGHLRCALCNQGVLDMDHSQTYTAAALTAAITGHMLQAHRPLVDPGYGAAGGGQ